MSRFRRPRTFPPLRRTASSSLDTALHNLAELNPRHALVVECRFFGGMTIEETASALGISAATAKRDWMILRGWLQRELERGA